MIPLMEGELRICKQRRPVRRYLVIYNILSGGRTSQVLVALPDKLRKEVPHIFKGCYQKFVLATGKFWRASKSKTYRRVKVRRSERGKDTQIVSFFILTNDWIVHVNLWG